MKQHIKVSMDELKIDFLNFFPNNNATTDKINNDTVKKFLSEIVLKSKAKSKPPLLKTNKSNIIESNNLCWYVILIN